MIASVHFDFHPHVNRSSPMPRSYRKIECSRVNCLSICPGQTKFDPLHEAGAAAARADAARHRRAFAQQLPAVFRALIRHRCTCACRGRVEMDRGPREASANCARAWCHSTGALARSRAHRRSPAAAPSKLAARGFRRPADAACT
jgi:hypothetical protein